MGTILDPSNFIDYYLIFFRQNNSHLHIEFTFSELMAIEMKHTNWSLNHFDHVEFIGKFNKIKNEALRKVPSKLSQYTLCENYEIIFMKSFLFRSTRTKWMMRNLCIMKI